MAAATCALMTWGLNRPALWLDEAATVLATQRRWADLWVLLGGAEAPLVPYYALVKLASPVAGLPVLGAGRPPGVFWAPPPRPPLLRTSTLSRSLPVFLNNAG